MSKKRDAAYFEARLKREHPAIYADLRSGKIKSVRQAAAKAGLIHLPDRLGVLKREWQLSSPHQRSEFIKWIKSSGIGVKSRTSAPVADASGRLTSQAISFIEGWVKKNRTTPGQIMKQMGYKNFDYRLSQSL